MYRSKSPPFSPLNSFPKMVVVLGRLAWLLQQSLLFVDFEYPLLHGFSRIFCWIWMSNLPLFVRNFPLNFQIWFWIFPGDNVLHYLLQRRLFLCSSRNWVFWAWFRIVFEFFLIPISSPVSWDVPEYFWSWFAAWITPWMNFEAPGVHASWICSFWQPATRYFWICFSGFQRAF